MKQRQILLYMFAIHGGHLRFFEQHRDAERLNILGPEFLENYPGHPKIISAIEPALLAAMIRGLEIFPDVRVVGLADREELNRSVLVMTDEAPSRALKDSYFPEAEVEFSPAFLQWNKERVFTHTAVAYDATISGEEFDRAVLRLAAAEAEKSSDWWRHVGSVLVKKGEVLLAAHNEHLPSEHMPYIFCDPRVFTEAGKDPHICTAIHSEQSLIAAAARRGIALEGADLYVTTFPCPVCAKLVSRSGIKRVFFREGHASLDGESVLKDAGVEIIHVN